MTAKELLAKAALLRVTVSIQNAREGKFVNFDIAPGQLNLSDKDFVERWIRPASYAALEAARELFVEQRRAAMKKTRKRR